MPAPTTAANGQIVKKAAQDVQRKAAPAVVDFIKSPEFLEAVKRALPRHLTPDRMARIVLTAVRANPKLAQCTPDSFFACVLQASQLGLEPNTPLGQAYLIPRNRKFKGPRGWESRLECTLMVGYQGMMDLALRSGRVRSMYACAVREGDAFDYERGLHERLRHVPSADPDRERRPITHVYAVARLPEGEPIWDVLSIGQVEARRARSGSADDGPWITDYEAMTLKTAIRAIFRWVPKSSEIARIESLESATDRGEALLSAIDPEVSASLDRLGLAPVEGEADAIEGADPTGTTDSTAAIQQALDDATADDTKGNA